jgi:hypothetical protein
MPALNVLYILASVPEINRRNIMITMGLGALGAAMSLPEAWAHPSPPAAPADAAPGSYIFHDEFDGPAGQGPDLAKWTPQTWQVDLFEWYGNGQWAPGTTVHAASNGKTWEGKSIPGMVDDAWHTWRMRWDENGFKFWRDYVDGAKPYFSVPPKPIHVFGAPPEDKRWPFSNPGYWLSPMFTLAVGGVGAGDPAAGTFPCQMLVDYIRVW